MQLGLRDMQDACEIIWDHSCDHNVCFRIIFVNLGPFGAVWGRLVSQGKKHENQTSNHVVCMMGMH